MRDFMRFMFAVKSPAQCIWVNAMRLYSIFPAFIEAILEASDYELNPLVCIRFASLAGHSGVNGKCEAVLPRCTVGSRQAEHESRGESMEEDDMVMRWAIASVDMRRTDEEGRATSPRDL